MQTHFSPAQLLDPRLAEVDRILRACVHCGFCTATCPTYVLKGDERDSPRGRIYLIKDMLENGRPATAEEVGPIDRCLSCLSCTSTCPSGVDYMHLVDHARAYIEETYARPRSERLVRALIARVLPYPRRFRLALKAAALGRPFAGLLARAGLAPLAAMLRLAARQGLGQQRGHGGGGVRGVFAHLDQHPIACRQRVHQRTQGQIQRVIPRHDHSDHPQGLRQHLGARRPKPRADAAPLRAHPAAHH